MASLIGGNIPQMSSCSHAHTVYDGNATAMGLVNMTQTTAGMGQLANLGAQQNSPMFQAISQSKQDYIDRVMGNQPKQETKVADPKRRLIKVIIADPDEKVPLDKCLLYSSEEKLTDLNDQELFFEIDIKTILDDHNLVRISILDKTVKERKEYLEPVKVRDLRMVVVTVATF